MELTWEQVRSRMQELAESRGDWAGYPVPLDDLRLVLAPTFPYQGLNGFKNDNDEEEDVDALFESLDDETKKLVAILYDQMTRSELINEWFSYERNCKVLVYRDTKTGKSFFKTEKNVAGERLTFAMNTLGASRAWDLELELRAINTLKSLVTESAFKYYILTGGFLETSKRSGVTYFFRKLRPTVALKASGGENIKILNVLCLHPIGHYEASYAGCMVPTDDIIAHLQLMRADEHKFWAKANHHPSYEACSGI